MQWKLHMPRFSEYTHRKVHVCGVSSHPFLGSGHMKKIRTKERLHQQQSLGTSPRPHWSRKKNSSSCKMQGIFNCRILDKYGVVFYHRLSSIADSRSSFALVPRGFPRGAPWCGSPRDPKPPRMTSMMRLQYYIVSWVLPPVTPINYLFRIFRIFLVWAFWHFISTQKRKCTFASQPLDGRCLRFAPNCWNSDTIQKWS